MSTSTKVLSADLKPIMQRVPQVAGIIKDAYGTIDTEVIGKMGISTQELIGKVIGGLEQLPKVAGGIKNSFENLDDMQKEVYTSIGNLLTPVITTLTPILESFMQTVKGIAEWFGQLPGPVQAAVGGVAAFLAVLGPVVAAAGAALLAFTSLAGALAPLGLTIAGLTATLAPWVIGIAAVAAALAALGVWVYENWDPIVATLTSAWEGITEAWTATWEAITDAVTGIWDAFVDAAEIVWGPYIKFFSTLWDAIGPYFVSVWNGIKSALTSVWSGIQSAASTVWGGIVKVFETFLEWAGKIPGVNKLMDLGTAWDSAKKLKTETEAASNAVKDLGKSAAGAAGPGKPIPQLETGLKKAGKAAKETTDKVKPLVFHNAELEATVKILESRYKKANEEIAKAKLVLRELGDAMPTMIQPTEAFNDSLQRIITSAADLSTKSIPALGTVVGTVTASIEANAKLAYDAVMGSKSSTEAEKNTAMVRMMEAQRAAAIENKEKIPAAFDEFLADIKAKSEQKVPALATPWQTMTTDVTGIITSFTQDIAKSLFEGDFSFGEKAKTMLSSLGTAVASSFTGPGATQIEKFIGETAKILFDGELSWGDKAKAMLSMLGDSVMKLFVEPGTKAINNLITGALADLISGKGFGGVLDSIKGLGTAMGDIFGAGKDVAGAAGGAAGAAGDIAGGAGSAAGSVGGAGSSAGSAAGSAAGMGVSAVVGMVTGIVSAISGVWSNFQNIQMEKGINEIEKSTRYLKIGLVEQSDSLLNDSHKIRNFLDGQEQNYWGTTVETWREMQRQLEALDRLQWIEFKLIDIYGVVLASMDRLFEISSNTYATQMATERSAMALEGSGAWTVTFTGDSIASAVGNEIMRQLRMQGVNLVPGR